MFLCDLAKILQILNCFGHFCLKSAQALNMEVYVVFGSASFRWVPVGSGGFRWNGLFQSNFGILRAISGGIRPFFWLDLVANWKKWLEKGNLHFALHFVADLLQRTRNLPFSPKKGHVHPKKHQNWEFDVFQGGKLQNPRDLGMAVHGVRRQGSRGSPDAGKPFPRALSSQCPPMPNIKSFDRCLSRRSQEVMEETEQSRVHARKRCFCWLKLLLSPNILASMFLVIVPPKVLNKS